jgi:hypothetical protein
MAADDVFDTVSGTLGLTGGVDTIAILKRSNQGVTLHIQGRDLVEDVEKAVTARRAGGRSSARPRSRVLSALRKAPAEGLSVSEIVADAEIGSRENAYQILHRMTELGEIVRRARGKYGLPGEPLSGMSGTQEAAEIPRKQGTSPDADRPDDPDTAETLPAFLFFGKNREIEMARTGRRKGTKKTGGRKKGSVNKATARMREAMAANRASSNPYAGLRTGPWRRR